ncbi:DUF4832 domain-containing protein [Xanthobacter autotrophicus]|uniref:DUF4874 domain-containing protein n=1 Tax=Xanthobacter autotrophicus TaxID=280 RepID=UPI001E37D5BA|nr:DUF4874 domain-containing protein [Xanthobacter autotrophicus]UDQ88171.1 DUF4832 domain-containing protein [Xanthobacter autotrophicus]
MRNLYIALWVLMVPMLSGHARAVDRPANPSFYETKGDTPNPDRGAFAQIRIDNTLRFGPLPGAGKNFRLYFVLDRYFDQLLPDNELANLGDSLAAAARGGKRVVIRFIYDYPDAELLKAGLSSRRARTPTPEMMSAHIRQLAEVIGAHGSAVFAIESGMIGYWGEQHGDTPDKQRAEGVAAVVDQWRAALKSTNIQVLARYPRAMRAHVRSHPDMLRQQPRFGYWNDCLGAYDDDNLTSNEVSISVGETCALKPRVDYSCPTMMAYFKSAQLSLLHANFYKPTLDQWAAEGCKETIMSHLGYRYVIREARLASDRSNLDLQIDNVGWGRSLVPRALFLVAGERRIMQIADLADFAPGSTNRLQISLDPSIDWTKLQLSLETDDGVRFSNTTGNVVFAPSQPR